MEDSRTRRSGCPVSGSLDILGDKWSLLIVRDMVFQKSRHFRHFLNANEGIASNILTDRLGKLERAGVISKETDPASKRQVIYSLTDKGKALAPLLVELVYWGAVYDEAPDVTRAEVRRMKKGHDSFKKSLLRRLIN